MAISLGISRDVQVSYSISEVKSAVEEVALVSKSKCQIEGRDDVMNTFKIALIGGMLVIVPITLQLKRISETETQIVLTSNKATNTGNQANDIADAFLSKLSQALSGTLEVPVQVEPKKMGWFGKIFWGSVILLAILALLSKLM